MPNLETYYGSGSASTVTPAGPGPGGPSELENFYRDLLARQSRQLAPQPAPQPGREFGYVNAPNQRAAETYRPEESALDVARRNDALQEMAYRKRLRDIDLSPPQKFIDSRPGVNGGYIQDTTLLPVSMRPKEAAIQHGPQDTARALNQSQNQTAFDAKLDADRRRTANGNFEY